MIDTIITFVLGAWFGSMVGFVIAGLMAASWDDY